MSIRKRCACTLAGLVLLCMLPRTPHAQGRCSVDGVEGIGGTGVRSDVPVSTPQAQPRVEPEGLGGTGQLDSPWELLEIEGTITGFASVCVDGIEVEYEPTTPIEINGRPASDAGLAIGQVVRIDARTADGTVRALRIAERSAVAGPIERRMPEDGELRVLGQRIVLPPDSIVSDRTRNVRLALADLELGNYVAVSGMRRSDGAIVASRVDREPPQDARISGRVTSVEGNSVRLGELRVETPGAPGVAVGDEVTVAGQLRGSDLVATTLVREPELSFGSEHGLVALEGFVQKPRGRDGFTLHDTEVDLAPIELDANFQGLEVDRRVRLRGRVADGRIAAEQLEVRDDAMGAGEWRSLGRPRPEPLDRRQAEAARAGSGRMERGERVERSERPERVERPERSGR